VCDHGVLIDVRRHGARFDPRLAQEHQPGGGRRGETDLHAFTVAAPSPACGMLGGWMPETSLTSK
jgi:hypothetical protein